MDAFDFFKTYHRMCSHYIDCSNCPLDGCTNIENWSDEVAAKNIPLVEQWGKEHPTKTRASIIEKMFPDVLRLDNETPAICPSSYYDGRCPYGKIDCFTCRKRFWSEEVKD